MKRRDSKQKPIRENNKEFNKKTRGWKRKHKPKELGMKEKGKNMKQQSLKRKLHSKDSNKDFQIFKNNIMKS